MLLTVGAMQTYPDRRTVLELGGEPPRILCTTCEHAELIHGDHGARRCLYTECRCSRFTVGTAPGADQTPGNHATQAL